MNKELIERLALECADKWDLPGDSETIMDFAVAFLAAVDAERRKEAACWQFQDTDGSWHYFVDERHKENTIAAGYPVRPLFLAPQPAIPEGMALIPPAKEFPPLYPDESADEQLKLAHYISGWNGCRDSMIASAGIAP